MAAYTKSRTSIWSAQSLTAGAGNTTSSWVGLSTTLGSVIDISLTNGATGPAVPAQVEGQVANNYKAGGPTLITNFGGANVGSTTNSDVTYFSIEIICDLH